MIIGLGFIAIGIFIYMRENYNMDIVEGEKVFSKKENLYKDRLYMYKITICVFSLVLGVFRILSSIIF